MAESVTLTHEVGAGDLGTRGSAAAQRDGPFAQHGAQLALDLEMRLDRAGVGDDLLVEGVPDGHDELRRGAPPCAARCGGASAGCPGRRRRDRSPRRRYRRVATCSSATKPRSIGWAGIALVGNHDPSGRCSPASSGRASANRRGPDGWRGRCSPRRCARAAAGRTPGRGPGTGRPGAPGRSTARPGQDAVSECSRATGSLGERAGGREVIEDERVEAVAGRREDPGRDAQHPLAGCGEVTVRSAWRSASSWIWSASRCATAVLRWRSTEQPVLEAEQHDEGQDDDRQRDPEDATASESRTSESPEKGPGHTRAAEVASGVRARRLVAFHDRSQRHAASRRGEAHARAVSIAAR